MPAILKVKEGGKFIISFEIARAIVLREVAGEGQHTDTKETISEPGTKLFEREGLFMFHCN